MINETNTFSFTKRIDVIAYNELRDMVGWIAIPIEEAQSGIDHSAFTISCLHNSQTVGVARLLWDRGYTAYLSDVIVHPDYQGQGIGRQMVLQLAEELKAQLKPGWKTKICLLAATGKEPFYEKLGFIQRPNDHSGAGMELWLYS